MTKMVFKTAYDFDMMRLLTIRDLEQMDDADSDMGAAIIAAMEPIFAAMLQDAIDGGLVMDQADAELLFVGKAGDQDLYGSYTFHSSDVDKVPVTIEATAGQVANLTEWKDENGVVQTFIGPDGVFTLDTLPAITDLDLLHLAVDAPAGVAIEALAYQPSLPTILAEGSQYDAGTISITHNGWDDGEDRTGAGLDILMRTTVTGFGDEESAAAGIYIHSADGSAPAGNPIKVHANDRFDMWLTRDGRLGLRTPDSLMEYGLVAALQVYQDTTEDLGLLIIGAENGQDLLRITSDQGALSPQVVTVDNDGYTTLGKRASLPAGMVIGALDHTDTYGGSPGVLVLSGVNTSGGAPTSSPISGGGILYVQAGALKYRGQDGTVTVIAAS